MVDCARSPRGRLQNIVDGFKAEGALGPVLKGYANCMWFAGFDMLSPLLDAP